MSGVLVLKFGGTSLATSARVRSAARRVRAHRRRGALPVVVVSAGGRTTDAILGRLDALARARARARDDADGAADDAMRGAVSREGGGGSRRGVDGPADREADREADRALATGEDLSAALLALALVELGVPARSLRGGEAGIVAEGPFGSGRIRAVDPGPPRRLLARGFVPVVSGFQATRADGETATLGRGGSDTSAVAIAAALGPVPCHIITDVRAVFDRDPAHVPDAVPFEELSHQELVALCRGGASVVHPHAADLALARRVPLRVYHHRDRLLGGGGTRIVPDGPRAPEEPAARKQPGPLAEARA